MTQKEIDELQERVYAISYSKFPLDTFFNDIQNNQAPNFNKESAYEDLKLITDEFYRLRELEKTPTLEEVKKEWEELGYEIYQEKKYIAMKNKTKKIEIIIDFKDRDYFKRDDDNFWEIISLQEHQLLTRTMKALGWFDE